MRRVAFRARPFSQPPRSVPLARVRAFIKSDRLDRVDQLEALKTSKVPIALIPRVFCIFR